MLLMVRKLSQSATEILLGLLIVAISFSPHSAAQTLGKLSYDPDSQTGLLTLSRSSGKLVLLGATPSATAGRVLLYDSNVHEDRVQLMVDDNSQGRLVLLGSTGKRAVRLEVEDATDHGVLQLFDGSDSEKAHMGVTSESNGNFWMKGSGTNLMIHAGQAGSTTAGKKSGRIRVFADGNTQGVLMADPTSGGGKLVLYNSDGDPTITLVGESGNITKSGSNGFQVVHPDDSSKEIHYVSLEGPENGMYVRGTARLEAGRAVVILPEHFSRLAAPTGMTVHLTPCSADTYGLAVVRKSPSEIEVRELGGGASSFAFDYAVFATRKDIPVLTVVQDRGMDSVSRER
jgi:hypothetical protein